MLSKSFLFIVCCFWHWGVNMGGNVPAADINSLEYLYNNTSGNYWTWENNSNRWDFNEPNVNPCLDNWEGIGCNEGCSSSSSCNIISVLLTRKNMTGSLPSQFFEMSELQSVMIFNNSRLNGTIPASLGSLSVLTVLHLQINALQGYLPDALASLAMLQEMNFSYNYFSGPIPLNIGKLTCLTYINLGENYFSGTFPSELFEMSGLLVINLHRNCLFDTIPVQISQMTQLQQLYLGNNCLTGSIPDELGSLTSLEVLDLRHAGLTGTIPSTLGNAVKMSFLYLADNDLCDMVPTSFSKFHDLNFLNITANSLDGTFPSYFGDFSLLQYLSMGQNLFHSSLPDNIGNASSLRLLNIDSNSFDGTLPTTFQLSTSLRSLSLDGNYFGGKLRLPLSSIGLLSAASNEFEGDINDIFPIERNYSALLVVILNSNKLTGTVPYHVITAPSMLLFTANNNCFGGELTDALCNSTTLLLLDLSSITSACKEQKLIRGFMYEAVKGTIPRCLFDMTSLQTLILFGNGIYSKIPDMTTGSALLNVELSNNRLHGTIPQSLLQSSQLTYMGLSHNYLSGTIEELNHPKNVLFLHTNRLSGDVPSSTKVTETIEMLEGNMFSCKSISSLPIHDKHREEYSCGSNNLNNYLYYCISIMLSIGVMIIIAIYGDRYFPAFHCLYIRIYTFFLNKICLIILNNSGKEILVNTLHQLRWYTLGLTLFIVVVYCPAYFLLKYYGYGTYTNQYGWYPSIALMDGQLAAIVVFGITLVFVSYCMVSYNYLFPQLPELGLRSQVLAHSWLTTTLRLFVVSCFLCCGLGLNYGYLLMLKGVDLSYQYYLTVMIALFTTIWNDCVVYPCLRRVNMSLHDITLVLLFNAIIVPIIGTLAVDVNCFVYLFYPDTVTYTSYASYTIRTDQYGDITIPIPFSRRYTTAFIYSDSCSSAILTNYAPLYVLAYGLNGILIPFGQVMLAWYIYNSKEGHYQLGNISMLQVIKYWKRNAWLWYVLSLGIINKWTLPLLNVEELDPTLSVLSGESVYRAFYGFEWFTVVMITNVTMLVTFGVCYPPLAVLIFFSIVMQTVTLQLCVDYHFQQVRNMYDFFQRWNKILTTELSDFNYELARSVKYSFIYCSIVISFFLLDMTLATHGSKRLLVVYLLPVVLITTMVLLAIIGSLTRIDFGRLSVVSLSTDDGDHNRKLSFLQVFRSRDSSVESSKSSTDAYKDVVRNIETMEDTSHLPPKLINDHKRRSKQRQNKSEEAIELSNRMHSMLS